MTTTIYISYSGDGIKKQDAYTYDAVGNRLTSHKNSDVGRWTLDVGDNYQLKGVSILAINAMQ